MRPFHLDDPSVIPSPALLFDLDGIMANLRCMLELAGSPARLRPHMKTHKTRELSRLYLEHGITRHKCATLMEAKVLAEIGAPDVLIAYPMIGPNQRLICELAQRYPATRFSVLGENLVVIHDLATEARRRGVQLGVYLDVNVGQDRTGVQQSDAVEIGQRLLNSDTGVQLRGLHLYDGQNTAVDPGERQAHVRTNAERGLQIRDQLGEQDALELVFGGTPAFMWYSKALAEPNITLSPGTCILHDVGYGLRYPELGFTPAAAVLTRVVSRPRARLVTFDVGTKAICSDPPAGLRCILLGLENAKAVLHNEEHLVVEASDDAADWQHGAVTLAMPMHVCPTVALYDAAYVLQGGKAVARYDIAARGRLRETTLLEG